jgi:NADH-quinone oxidoreductase subunit B
LEKRSIKMGLDKKSFISELGDDGRTPEIPKDFPGKVIPAGNGANVIVTSLDKIVNWGRSNSLWSLYFGTSCCAIEMMQAGGPRTDLDRFGVVFRATPRQADFIFIAVILSFAAIALIPSSE